jgi:hypothetical protein
MNNDSYNYNLDLISFLSNKMNRILSFTIPLFAVFLMHYISANAYASICAPIGFSGLVQSLFTTSSPVCNSLLSIINYTSNNYNILMTSLIAIGCNVCNEWMKPIRRQQRQPEVASPESS